jgi:hypothetical protein
MLAELNFRLSCAFESYLARVEVRQVQGVPRETGSAIALPLDEESILEACERNLSEPVRDLPRFAIKITYGKPPRSGQQRRWTF